VSIFNFKIINYPISLRYNLEYVAAAYDKNRDYYQDYPPAAIVIVIAISKTFIKTTH